jgi:hypothetical protein
MLPGLKYSPSPLSLLSTNKIDEILRKQFGENISMALILHTVHIMYKGKTGLKEKETHYWMF